MRIISLGCSNWETLKLTNVRILTSNQFSSIRVETFVPNFLRNLPANWQPYFWRRHSNGNSSKSSVTYTFFNGTNKQLFVVFVLFIDRMRSFLLKTKIRCLTKEVIPKWIIVAQKRWKIITSTKNWPIELPYIIQHLLKCIIIILKSLQTAPYNYTFSNFKKLALNYDFNYDWFWSFFEVWWSISQLTFSPSKVTFGLMFRDKLLLQLPNKLAFSSDFLINK